MIPFLFLLIGFTFPTWKNKGILRFPLAYKLITKYFNSENY